MKIYKGEDIEDISISLTYPDKTPFDFTEATEIVTTIRSGGTSVEKKLSLGEITNVSLGKFYLSLTSANTNSLAVSESASVLVTITTPTETRIAVIPSIKVRNP